MAPVAAPAPADSRSCGPLGCRLFASSTEAFRVVLEKKPLVLGVGEAHGQKATPGASSARRFTAEMLPELTGKASDLVVELMMPPRDCDKATKTAVSREIDKVTRKQADTNQDEYLAMSAAAKKLGITPHVLNPSCEDFKAISKKGADSVWVALQLVTRLMSEEAEQRVAANAKAGNEKMVVLYGGAIHNDIEPIVEGKEVSFGARLAESTRGRYVELDLFVPELVNDQGLWARFLWFEHFDKEAHPESATLFTLGPSAFTLLFPRGKAAP